MLEWIRETQDVWQRLQNTQKPIVMYGMGDGAVKNSAGDEAVWGCTSCNVCK